MAKMPPFSGLTAFYAAVRHGTLTGAARDLNVSQPAISRRIAALEQDLGTQLFDRSHKPARLTPHGRELMQALRVGFGKIEETAEEIRRSEQNQVVRVSGPSGFMGFWLIPRLAEIEECFPNIQIRVISQEYGEPERAGDISVRFGLSGNVSRPETRIMGDWVYPVASPHYLERRQNPTDLGSMTLLTMEAARKDWYDWPSWFNVVGLKMPKTAKTHDFSSYAMVCNAALAGQGVCLCWSGLFDNLLKTGALQRLDTPRARSERCYYISKRDTDDTRPEVTAIFDWIRRAATMPEADII